MPRQPNPVPTYRLHAASGQAVCTVRLADGTRKDLYLGVHDSAAAKAEYNRVVALVASNGGIYPTGSPELTISEALVQYGRHVDSHYVGPDGRPTGTGEDIKITLGYLKRQFGHTPLAAFGPPQLKAVRQAMVDDGRVREQVNKRISQVRQFFRWCVEEQVVEATVLLGLQAVRALDYGRSGVKEGKPRQPADPTALEKALPFMSPAVRAIVQLLRLTGARPSEILLMRPSELDRSGEIWILRPEYHKTSWRGKNRAIFFGPEAQAVLAPWLVGTEQIAYVFSPRKSEQLRSRERSEARKTKKWPSHMTRNEVKRAVRRQLAPTARYNRQSLGLAIRRACKRAGVAPFCPYSLRHLRAVELREKFGLETVRAVLGHSYKAMADHYSKAADATLASRAAVDCG
jgi:integrase